MTGDYFWRIIKRYRAAAIQSGTRDYVCSIRLTNTAGITIDQRLPGYRKNRLDFRDTAELVKKKVTLAEKGFTATVAGYHRDIGVSR